MRARRLDALISTLQTLPVIRNQVIGAKLRVLEPLPWGNDELRPFTCEPSRPPRKCAVGRYEIFGARHELKIRRLGLEQSKLVLHQSRSSENMKNTG